MYIPFPLQLIGQIFAFKREGAVVVRGEPPKLTATKFGTNKPETSLRRTPRKCFNILNPLRPLLGHQCDGQTGERPLATAARSV